MTQGGQDGDEWQLQHHSASGALLDCQRGLGLSFSRADQLMTFSSIAVSDVKTEVYIKPNRLLLSFNSMLHRHCIAPTPYPHLSHLGLIVQRS